MYVEDIILEIERLRDVQKAKEIVDSLSVYRDEYDRVMKKAVESQKESVRTACTYFAYAFLLSANETEVFFNDFFENKNVEHRIKNLLAYWMLYTDTMKLLSVAEIERIFEMSKQESWQIDISEQEIRKLIEEKMSLQINEASKRKNVHKFRI